MSGAGLTLLLSSICLNCSSTSFYDNPPVLSPSDGQQYKGVQDLSGTHLRIGTLNSPPYSWTELGEDGKLVGKGVAFTIVNMLQEALNFTYDVVVPEKNWFGSVQKMEDSLLGLINSSSIDLAAAFVPRTVDAVQVAFFSSTLAEGRYVMMLKRPKESAAGTGLLAPFQSLVWYFILVSVLAFGPCITLLTKIRQTIMPDDEERPLGFNSSIWFVYGAFIKQGTTLSPEANTTRVLFATWWIFIILLSSYYTANLTAFLTLSKFTLDIEDPKDLYKKNYKWVASENGVIENVITNPEENFYYLYQMTTKGLGIFRNVDNDRDFLPDVNSGRVLIHDSIRVDHLMYNDYLMKVREGIEEKNRCTYVVTSTLFMTKLLAFSFPRHSEVLRIFDPMLSAIVESGIVSYLLSEGLPGAKICPLDLQSKERRLTNTDLLMTYMIAGAGIAAALAAFIGEMFIKRYVLRSKIRVHPINSNFKAKAFTWKDKSQRRKRRPRFDDDSRPPSYDAIFGKNWQYYDSESKKRQYINGRDYYVIKTVSGDVRLVPTRTPSALLYERQ